MGSAVGTWGITALAVSTLLALVLPLEAGSPHRIAVDSNRNLYEVVGPLTLIGVVSANVGTPGALAIGARNTVYVSSISNGSLFTVELPTGDATLVGPYGDPAIVMHGLEYVPATDTLYGVSSHNNGLYVVDKTTGATTLLGTSGLGGITNLGWNPNTGVMYATNGVDDSLYRMNLANGATTQIGPLGGPSNPSGLAYDAATDDLLLVDNTSDILYVVNTSTGVATAVLPLGPSNLLGLAYIDGPIPVELIGFAVE